MPYDPANPNIQGLPASANPGIMVQIATQRTQQNSMALLLLLVVLWAMFG
jgi:hypothetical protein